MNGVEGAGMKKPRSQKSPPPRAERVCKRRKRLLNDRGTKNHIWGMSGEILSGRYFSYIQRKPTRRRSQEVYCKFFWGSASALRDSGVTSPHTRCRAVREIREGHRPRMSYFRGEAAIVSSRRRLRRLRLGAARRAAPTLGERARGRALFVLIRAIRGSRTSGQDRRNRRSLVIDEVAARASFTVETTVLPSFALPRGVWIGRFLSGARWSREVLKKRVDTESV